MKVSMIGWRRQDNSNSTEEKHYARFRSVAAQPKARNTGTGIVFGGASVSQTPWRREDVGGGRGQHLHVLRLAAGSNRSDQRSPAEFAFPQSGAVAATGVEASGVDASERLIALPGVWPGDFPGAGVLAMSVLLTLILNAMIATPPSRKGICAAHRNQTDDGLQTNQPCLISPVHMLRGAAAGARVFRCGKAVTLRYGSDLPNPRTTFSKVTQLRSDRRHRRWAISRSTQNILQGGVRVEATLI
jgi:hypothetical protein